VNRSRLSASARRFYEFFNSLQFLGSLTLLWYFGQVLFNWARCENCCCSASCSTGSSHCHFPNYENYDDDMGDPTRSVVNALFVIALLQLFGAYLCACNIGIMRCVVAACSVAPLSYGFRRATGLTWLVCRPLSNPVGNNDNWKGVVWHESSHGRNSVYMLCAYSAVLVADCLLSGFLSLLNAAAFDPREHLVASPFAVEGNISKPKSE
jgi:hypothetical protein